MKPTLVKVTSILEAFGCWARAQPAILKDVIACYQEHFALVYEDILKMPNEKSLIVEGTALLPRQVAKLLQKRNQAIWLIPCADFQSAHYSQREWARDIVAQCSDPAVALHKWMERDIRFAEWVEAEATALDLARLRVDRKRTLEENAALVATHFQFAASHAP